MITRRDLVARIAMAAAAARAMPEMAYAQQAAAFPKKATDERIWLDSNENPHGPPPAVIQAMNSALAISNRYHFGELAEFENILARSEGLRPEQIIVGSGSSENLHAAVHAFTSPSLPLITTAPGYETPTDVAQAVGHRVISVPVTAGYYADVRAMASAAEKAGGLIYICNPNNPTSAVTPKADIDWLVEHLPAKAVLVVDEAYIHYAETPLMASALPYVRAGKNVVVMRTFSKIYGMAGLRVGFACAKPELILQMAPFRLNVISIVSARAVAAALSESKDLLPARKAENSSTRRELCEWLRRKNIRYVEPQANFIMIDVKRNVREFGRAMAKQGVMVGRPFPPLDNLLRVTIGTSAEMARFRDVLARVYEG